MFKTGEKIIAGTGHRMNKLGGYNPLLFDRLIYLATKYLEFNTPEYVISGMALGWDQALAQASINLKIPFVAAIAFKGQEAHWPESSQEYYHNLISKCKQCVVVSPGDFTNRKMQLRNEYMVNECTTLVALWDGSEGGTKNCLDYAKTKNDVIIHNLWDQWVKLNKK